MFLAKYISSLQCEFVNTSFFLVALFQIVCLYQNNEFCLAS